MLESVTIADVAERRLTAVSSDLAAGRPFVQAPATAQDADRARSVSSPVTGERRGTVTGVTSPTAGWRYIGTRTRLVAMAVVGAIALVLTGLFGRWSDAPVAGWDAMAVVFVAWVWCSIGVMDSTLTRAHATREDPGRAASDIIVVLAAVASLAAVGVVLVQANAADGTSRGLLAGLGVASIALSWLSVNTLFTLRYALLYYSPAAGGIDFNSDEPPCYSDFAYLAFTIGMTYQVSDTDISRRSIRASLLRHSLLSYLLGAVVLASSINLVVAIGS